MIEKFANEVRSLIENHDINNTYEGEDIDYPVPTQQPPLVIDTTAIAKKPKVFISKQKSTLPTNGNMASPQVSLEPLVQL